MERVVVAGGGVVGTACALALSDRGYHVALLSPGLPSASAYAAGILLPNAVSRASGPLGALNFTALGLWPEFEDRLGGGLRRTHGLLQLADDQDHARVSEWPALFSEAGLQAEWLSELEARELYPQLSERAVFSGAAWLPEVSSVDPLQLVSVLRLELARSGRSVFYSSPLVGVDWSGGEMGGVVLASGQQLSCDALVVACGFSDYSFLPDGLRPALSAQMGERALISLAAPWPERPILGTPGGSLLPRFTPQLWAGVTARQDGPSGLTAGGAAHVLSNACTYLPELADCSLLEVGAGLRPLSADGLPLVGASGAPGLFVACGHGRDGVLQSPAAGLALADLVSGGRLPEWSSVTDPAHRLV